MLGGMKLSHLTIYPIKSCGGAALRSARIGPRGLEAGVIGDRRWIVCDAQGSMITQRQNESLARVRIELLEGVLRVSGDGLEPVIVDPGEAGEQRATVILHGREV